MSVKDLIDSDDEQLGEVLRALEPMLLTPVTPDVAGSVTDAIRTGRRPRRRLPSEVRLAILVAAALLLLATAAAAARLVLDIGGIRIEPPPPTLPSASHPPLAGPAFGEPTTPAAAQSEAGFRPVVPEPLGKPDRVWIARGIEPGNTMIALAWFPRPGLPRIPGTPYGASLIEARSDVDLVVKFVRAPFIQLSHGMYWIRAPHDVELLTGGETKTFHVTGHVLIWQDGGIAFRLENNLPRSDALALIHRSA